MPRETFTHTAVASAPIADVWKALDKPLTWESIGGIDRVVDSVIDSEGRLQSFSFDTMVAGKPYRGEATTAGREELQMMAWNIENSEVAGLISVALSEPDQRTAIAVTLIVESKGMLAGMFFPVVSKAIGDGLPRSVDRFATEF